MSILHKIKNKIRFIIEPLLVKLTILLDSPKMTAFIFSRIANNVNGKGEHVVLCIGRSIFMDDVGAMAQFSGRIKYRVVNLSYFQIIFDHFAEKDERKSLTEANYYVNNYCQKGKDKYRAYLERMFDDLRRYLGFQAIISGNIGYIIQQELSKVAEEHKVPFIVLHKEAMVLPDYYDRFLSTYKDRKFFGAKILFYNKQCLDGFVNLNLPGLSREKAKLVGIPRFDRYFLQPASKVEPGIKQVTFFSFIPRISLRFISQDEEIFKKLDDRVFQFYRIIVDFALRHPEIKIIIKTKVADQFIDYARKMIKDNGGSDSGNITVTNFADPSELIRSSQAVVGFNSTTLIEALISKKIIISPYFGDILLDINWSFFQKYPELVNYAKSLEDLENFVFSSEKYSQYPEESKNKFLEEYISTSNGGAARKAEDEIINSIKEYKNLI